MPDNVPIRNSAWSGTGTVMVVPYLLFCMMMWLPFQRTCSNPWLDSIVQTCRPESTRNRGMF